MTQQYHPLVSTRTGVYRGVGTGAVEAFRGIRYALAPFGERRFRPPVPVPPSGAVIEATDFAPVAPQPGRLSRLGGADCLALNIWRRADAARPRPVLFYVHGGSFMHGSGSEGLYDGTRLARKLDVLVVTINYRLGAFGFLDLSCVDDGFAANNGLLDVVLALRWTYENIEQFGGDPANITVIGESAGGSLASVLPLLDDSGPMVSRLVLMSGVPTAFLTPDAERELARRFLSFLGIKRKAALAAVSDTEITAKTYRFVRDSGYGTATFQPVIDGRILWDYPIAMLNHGGFGPIPMLIGSTKDELSLIKHPILKKSWDINYAVRAALRRETPEVRRRLASLYAATYGTRDNQIRILSDVLFRTAALFYAEAAAASCPVWLYRFDFEPWLLRLAGLGAAHASDLPVLFGNLRTGIGKVMFGLSADLSGAWKVSREMQSDLGDFMTSGTLAWPKAFSERYIAKCYDTEPSHVEPIPREIYRSYRSTAYYDIHMRGHSDEP